MRAWGTGEYLVAEADESDGSFLLLQPVVALVTNIDRDHLESYDGSFEQLRAAFAGVFAASAVLRRGGAVH